MPATPLLASVRLLRVPLVSVSVTVRLSPSASATVKSSSAAATPAVTVCAEPGTPESVGASFWLVIDTVTLPLALSVPPVPWRPRLPSENTQLICAVAGGVSDVLL